MILYNPLQKRNYDKSRLFFWHGITTVGGSEIWRSPPWDVDKTHHKIDGINFYYLSTGDFTPDFWTIDSMNQPRLTSFHNVLWLGTFGMSIQPSGCTEVATTTDGLTIQPCGHGGASIHDSRRENDGWNFPSLVFSPIWSLRFVQLPTFPMYVYIQYICIDDTV